MATTTVARTCHPTLSGTTVDDVVLTDAGITQVEILNDGSTSLWVTLAVGSNTPTVPVARAAGTYQIRPGDFANIPLDSGYSGPVNLKVLGASPGSNPFSVHGQLA